MFPVIFITSLSCALAALQDYTDDFARNTMYPLEAAAHSSNPQPCLTNTFGDGKLRRQLSVQCHAIKGDKCSAFTAFIPSKRAIAVSFMGAVGPVQIGLINVGSNVETAWIAGGKVEKYYNDAFLALWKNGLKDDFSSLRNQYPDYDIYITGHSMGASLASLAASYIVATGLTPGSAVKLVTFGEPRIGNRDFAEAHDAQLDFSFRVNHWQDPVPQAPKENDAKYYHHKYEVFCQEEMLPDQFTLCEENEDPNCSDGMRMLTVSGIIYTSSSRMSECLGMWDACGTILSPSHHRRLSDVYILASTMIE